MARFNSAAARAAGIRTKVFYQKPGIPLYDLVPGHKTPELDINDYANDPDFLEMVDSALDAEKEKDYDQAPWWIEY